YDRPYTPSITPISLHAALPIFGRLGEGVLPLLGRLFCFVDLPPALSTLFPYTTLFRSLVAWVRAFIPFWVASRVLWMSLASQLAFSPLFTLPISSLALVAARAATSANCSSVTPLMGTPGGNSESFAPGL